MTGKPTDSAPWEDPCASLRGIIAAAQEPRRFGAAHEMIVPVSLLSAVVAEMIQTRLQRDEARRMWCESEPVGNCLSVDDMYRRARVESARRGWNCYAEPRWNSDPRIISPEELARCTRNMENHD